MSGKNVAGIPEKKKLFAIPKKLRIFARFKSHKGFWCNGVREKSH